MMNTQSGGGVYFRHDELDSKNIEHFFFKLLSSHAQLLSIGSYSLIYVCDSTNMPFISTDLNTFGRNPTKVLLKAGIIYEIDNFEFGIMGKKIFSQTQEQFDNEIRSQNECYEKTCGYLQPLCPNILTSMVFSPTSKIHSYFRITHKSSTPKLSLIAMECINESEPMTKFAINSYDTDRNVILQKLAYHNMARYAVIELALTTSYIHRDLGLPNILISPNYTKYYNTIKGRASIIDFSVAKKIDGLSERIATIIDGDSPTKFVDALIAIADEEKKYLSVPQQKMRYDNWEYNGPGEISGYGWIFTPKFFAVDNKKNSIDKQIQ